MHSSALLGVSRFRGRARLQPCRKREIDGGVSRWGRLRVRPTSFSTICTPAPTLR